MLKDVRTKTAVPRTFLTFKNNLECGALLYFSLLLPPFILLCFFFLSFHCYGVILGIVGPKNVAFWPHSGQIAAIFGRHVFANPARYIC